MLDERILLSFLRAVANPFLGSLYLPLCGGQHAFHLYATTVNGRDSQPSVGPCSGMCRVPLHMQTSLNAHICCMYRNLQFSSEDVIHGNQRVISRALGVPI